MAVNGYGVIGKRVADAVAVQPDMEPVGIVDVGWRIGHSAGNARALLCDIEQVTPANR